MSWSVSVTSVDVDEFPDKVKEAFDVNYSEPADGVEDQFNFALEVAREFIENCGGSVVNTASLNGHARQGAADWGNSIGISLTVT